MRRKRRNEDGEGGREKRREKGERKGLLVGCGQSGKEALRRWFGARAG